MKNANKASFQNDLDTFKSDLSLSQSQIIANTNGEHNIIDENFVAGDPVIKEKYIPSLNNKYVPIIGIQSGQVSFSGTNPKEIAWAAEVGVITDVSLNGINRPNMLAGMIPVYFDEGANTWKKADRTNANNNWYDYDAKKWANIVTVEEANRNTYLNASVGTPIPANEINTMFVWIPRYAYSIQGGAYKKVTADTTGKIDAKFLAGVSNKDIDGKEYSNDYDTSKVAAGANTPYIVHPAFTFGKEQLKGIWVAKYEASASPNPTLNPNDNKKFPGNRYESSTPNAYGGKPYELEAPTASTYIKVVAGVPSWRELNVTAIFNQCMEMQHTDAKKYGWTSSNAHMMKNSEWGAVAYLAASKYGAIPEINDLGEYATWKNGASTTTGAYHNLMAGTDNFVSKKATSTTANVYGVYDMNGGSYEYTAAYLDNNNTSGGGNGLQNADAKYKDVYIVSDEEKKNQIADVSPGGSPLTQDALWEKTNTYNSVRKILTKASYDLMKIKKGDGIYETIEEGNYSYYGSNSASTPSNSWIKNKDDTVSESSNWDRDYSLLGHSLRPFFLRGGNYSDGWGAGVFSVESYQGFAYSCGFRPVLSGPSL